MSKTAIILVPVCADVENEEEADAFCRELDLALVLNHESLLERMGVEGEGKQLERNRFLKSTILGYVKWPFEE